MKLNEFFNVPIDPLKEPDPHHNHVSADEKERMANEVFWFILDNDSLHKEFVLPFVKDLKHLISSPNYDKERFTKYWSPMVSKGCNLFYKKEKLKKDPKNLFDQEFKDGICEKLTEKFIEEIRNDYYQVGDHKL